MTTYNSLKIAKRAIIIVGFSLLPFVAKAAVNGSVSSTASTGSINVFINVGAEVRLSGLTDYTQANWDGSAYEFERSFCVYSNNPDHLYTVTVTGTNNEPSFQLVNQRDPAHPVNYHVQYQDASSSAAYSAVVPGTRLVAMTGSGASDCGGATNATMKIDVDAANGESGVYSGTVNLLVMPQ